MVMLRVIVLFLMFTWPVQIHAQDVLRVFAAASLRGALEAALQDWQTPVSISYGGSGAIARQVSLGAPADIVILASTDWSDWLKDRVAPTGYVSALLSNRLVLIGAEDSMPFASVPTAERLVARLGSGRLAMGHRSAVPAGQYAKAWLSHIAAWDSVSPHLAEAENVRAALAFVARKEAPMGIVYGSDAVAERSVVVLWAMDPAGHPPIRYPAHALSASGKKALAYLQAPAAQAAFAAAGFLPAPDPDGT